MKKRLLSLTMLLAVFLYLPAFAEQNYVRSGEQSSATNGQVQSSATGPEQTPAPEGQTQPDNYHKPHNKQKPTTHSTAPAPAYAQPDDGNAKRIDPGDKKVRIKSTGSFSFLSAAHPQIQVTPLSVNFGSVEIGQTATQTITVSNVGSDILNIKAINKPGSPFTVTGNCGTSIQLKQSCSLNITFTPQTTNNFTNNLTIKSSDEANQQVTVAIASSGVPATVQTPTPTPTPTPNTPQITVTPNPIVMGDVQIDKTKTRLITVKNTGNGSFSIISIAPLSGYLSILNSSCNNISLGANNTCAFTVQFAPVSEGTVNQQVTINTDTLGVTGVTNVPVSGNGTTLAACTDFNCQCSRTPNMPGCAGNCPSTSWICGNVVDPPPHDICSGLISPAQYFYKVNNKTTVVPTNNTFSMRKNNTGPMALFSEMSYNCGGLGSGTIPTYGSKDFTLINNKDTCDFWITLPFSGKQIHCDPIDFLHTPSCTASFVDNQTLNLAVAPDVSTAFDFMLEYGPQQTTAWLPTRNGNNTVMPATIDQQNNIYAWLNPNQVWDGSAKAWQPISSVKIIPQACYATYTASTAINCTSTWKDNALGVTFTPQIGSPGAPSSIAGNVSCTNGASAPFTGVTANIVNLPWNAGTNPYRCDITLDNKNTCSFDVFPPPTAINCNPTWKDNALSVTFTPQIGSPGAPASIAGNFSCTNGASASFTGLTTNITNLAWLPWNAGTSSYDCTLTLDNRNTCSFTVPPPPPLPPFPLSLNLPTCKPEWKDNKLNVTFEGLPTTGVIKCDNPQTTSDSFPINANIVNFSWVGGVSDNHCQFILAGNNNTACHFTVGAAAAKAKITYRIVSGRDPSFNVTDSDNTLHNLSASRSMHYYTSPNDWMFSPWVGYYYYEAECFQAAYVSPSSPRHSAGILSTCLQNGLQMEVTCPYDMTVVSTSPGGATILNGTNARLWDRNNFIWGSFSVTCIYN